MQFAAAICALVWQEGMLKRTLISWVLALQAIWLLDNTQLISSVILLSFESVDAMRTLRPLA